MNTPSVEQDLALKRFAVTPSDQKPHYNWRDVLKDEAVTVPDVEVLCPHGAEHFDLSEVADTIGKSLANLLLARGEKDIFNDKNQRFVAAITREVAHNLTTKALERTTLRLSLHDLYVLIEKTLVDNNAYDVAKSLLLKRAQKLNVERDTSGVTVRLIRRNHHVVPWNEAKIEIAVRKAFLSLQRDPTPASAIARAVTARAQGLKHAFLHIEEVQDMVQEEIMRAGHFKIAEQYILYRAARAAARAAEPAAEDAVSAQQNSMIVVQRADGATYLWDGLDLKKRIEFATIGLDLCLTPDQIETDLRRSLFDNIAQGDLNNTIVLNAKTLIEKDADFAKFAGRIQLTYLYEEVLGWDIVHDGLGALKTFHQRAFAKYLEHGIAIQRLTPRLKEYDLARIAEALDPSADLELDFLGVQTLYDRYLIIDKTGKRARRIETPQFFWLRVAMGLFLDEKSDREAWAIRLYELYKSRRFCSSTPTLFNSGTLHSQLSSCYLYYVDDSIEGIFQRGIADNAYLSKWAGGLGGSWTSVRGTGAHIAGTNGESQGVIPFLKLHNDQLVAVNQCFAGDTLVVTEKGIRPIRDVGQNDLVLTEDSTFRPVKEKLVYPQHGHPMVKLTIKHGGLPIEVTAGHPLKALKGVPMEQSNRRTMEWLKKGKVALAWHEAGALDKGDYVALTVPSEIVDVMGFTEEDARFYGCALGDGHINSRMVGEKWGPYQEFGFTSDQATEHGRAELAFARTYLAKKGVHFWECAIHGTTGCIRFTWNQENQTRIPFTEDDLYEGRRKRIHPRFYHLPKLKSLALVEGLIMSDGTIARNNEIAFYNTERELTEGLRYLLLRCGIPTALYSRTRVYTRETVRADGTAAVFTAPATEYCVRIPAIKELAERLRVKPIRKRNWLVIGDYILSRVLAAEVITPHEIVYDLKVDGPESYSLIGALAHNGGKRKGSGCAYLETWHNDIFEFLELRRNTGDDRRRTHDMNTANWIPDLFMKRMEARQPWTLFRANETPELHHTYGRKFEEAYLRYEKLAEEGKIQAHKVEALELWKKMLSMLFETGHPWITFKDPCNVRSPQDHIGVIHSSNLCTEITLNTSNDETAVCNLGSVILETHLKPDGHLDHEKLRETIRVAVRALDNVIDINFYPTEAARRSNLRHRPIGLGVMGLADTLYKKGIPFASPAAVEFNDEFMEAIAYYAYEASSDLAAERGPYSSFEGSKWDRCLLPPDTLDLLEQERGERIDVPRGGRMNWAPLRAKIAAQGMRNSNCLAIAPTATISNITATSPCIEPYYKNLYVKSNLSGEFVVINAHLVKDLKARGLWNQEMIDNLKYFDGELKDIDTIPDDLKAKYLTAFDIEPKWIIDCAGRRQKWIDQSQSVNLWLKTPDLKTLSHMYRHAWHAGLKTTYYLRTLGASNIEKSTVHVKKEMRGATGEVTAVVPDSQAAAVAPNGLSSDPFPNGGLPVHPSLGEGESAREATAEITTNPFPVAAVAPGLSKVEGPNGPSQPETLNLKPDTSASPAPTAAEVATMTPFEAATVDTNRPHSSGLSPLASVPAVPELTTAPFMINAAAAPDASTSLKRVYSAEQKLACSIETMRNAGECEACQ